MLPKKRRLFWALAGNLVVGFGAGTATNAAFAPSLPVIANPHFAVRVGIVSLGFAFFFAGYHITQAGIYRSSDESQLGALVPKVGTGTKGEVKGNFVTFDPVLALRGASLLAGVVLLGAGMRLFALTIESWSATLGLLTGVVCILGYIFGHIGINWKLI